MIRRSDMGRLVALALLAALPLVSACSDESLNPPTPAAGNIFARYVAIGNSITAGFQSGGINDSTQQQSYAVLLAQEFGLTVGTDWYYPALSNPGCPPPYTDIFTQTRLATIPNDCAFRTSTVPPRLNNVAVPGAAVIDVLDNLDAESAPNGLTTILLGGRTQMEAAMEAQPTFVTVWIGNNDALGAVLAVGNSGSTALVTSPTIFADRYGAMMDSLDAIGTIQGGVLIGVVQVGNAPYLTQGRVWKQFEATYDALTSPLNALDVTNSCLGFQALTATDTAFVSVPFHYGGPALALANARVDSVQQGTLAPGALQTVTIDCTTGDVVTVAEMINLMTSVAAYNTAIEAEASARNWVFVDPNDLLVQLLTTPGAIRPFPAFDPTDPQHTSQPFGSALSLDGFHPSASTHVLIAQALIAAINTAYGTAVPTP